MSAASSAYGHLYPESDAALRDRLDAIYTQAVNLGETHQPGNC
jgi:hypothetical protein